MENNHSSQRYGDANKREPTAATKKCMLSTGLVKSGCPSCLIIGLAIMPIEMAGRGLKNLISGPSGDIVDPE
jgi:hypothetical protein